MSNTTHDVVADFDAETSTDNSADPAATQPGFGIQRIYIKDMSFEALNVPESFLKEWKPQIDIEVHNQSRQLNSETHDVILRITVTAKLEQQTAFVVEIQQAGIFSLIGLNAEQMGHVIGSLCPTILFPYAREAIASMITRGGFPTINLAPINFDAVYQQHLQQMQQQGGGSTAIN